MINTISKLWNERCIKKIDDKLSTINILMEDADDMALYSTNAIESSRARIYRCNLLAWKISLLSDKSNRLSKLIKINDRINKSS